MIATGEIFTKKEWKGIQETDIMVSSKGVKTTARTGKTLILGLGNTILSDDGVGIYIAREIGKRIQNPLVLIKEASIGGLELLDFMKGFNRVILIDGVVTGKHRPGTLLKLKPEDLEGGSSMSRHQVAFPEALMLGKNLNMDLPNEIVIYGVEVKDAWTFGESCTPEVSAKIPMIVTEIIRNEKL